MYTEILREKRDVFPLRKRTLLHINTTFLTYLVSRTKDLRTT